MYGRDSAVSLQTDIYNSLLFGLTRVARFEVENVRLSYKSVHVVHLVVFVLVAVDQVDDVVPSSETEKDILVQLFGGDATGVLHSGDVI